MPRTGNDAVKLPPVVEAVFREFDEVGDRVRRVLFKEFHGHGAAWVVISMHGESIAVNEKPPVVEGFSLSEKRDSNSRPQPWQGCALPTELFSLERCFVGSGRQNYAHSFAPKHSSKSWFAANFRSLPNELLGALGIE